jgi:hypothetical protein
VPLVFAAEFVLELAVLGLFPGGVEVFAVDGRSVPMEAINAKISSLFLKCHS